MAYICKGSWQLGTACGVCERCIATRRCEYGFLHEDGLCVYCERNLYKSLLSETRRYVQENVNMMADISRFAPLSPEDQVKHDNTEYPSEILLRKIDEVLK